MNTFNQLTKAQLSEQAYRDFDQADVDKATVAFTDSNGSDWTVYAVSETTGYDTGFSGVAFRNTTTDEVVAAYRGTDGPRDVTPTFRLVLARMCRTSIIRHRIFMMRFLIKPTQILSIPQH